MNIEGFELNDPFYDNRHFRVGFRRCGEFTIAQADILEQYGRTLAALARGEKTPVSEAEKHFVDFCNGKKAAESFVEQTWSKYQSLLNKRNLVSAFGSNYCKPDIVDLDDSDDDDDGELGVVGDIDDVDDFDDDDEELAG